MKGIGNPLQGGASYAPAFFLGLTAALLTVFAASAANAPGGTRAKFHQDAVLVSFKSEAPANERSAVLARLGLGLDPKVQSPYFSRVKLGASAKRAGIRATIAALRKNASIAIVEPDYIVQKTAVPNDPLFGDLWGLNNTGQTGGIPDADIDAPEAWNKTTGGAAVVVAVIDTGVDYMHPDLAPNMMRDSAGNLVGYDYFDGDDDPLDEDGHGSHCAGTIGGKGNNSVGVAGVCWTVKLMPLRFIGPGGGSTSAAIQCIDFARTKGAKIMSNSWGGGGRSELLLAAIKRARDAGILFVAAAGNDASNNDNTPSYPASYNGNLDNVISVAASDSSDALASFSNFGATTVDLAAPGVGILSTTGGDYELFDGTSMACPHVSGVAALVKAKYPSLNYTQIKARLLGNVDSSAALVGKVKTGRLNANGALGTDAVAPGAPQTLSVTHRTGSGLQISMKSSGDDGAAGTAYAYDLRYSLEPITSTTFLTSAAAVNLPAPGVAGTTKVYYLQGLDPGKNYYLALRALDEAGNMSPITYAGSFGHSTLALITSLTDSADSALKFTGQVVSGSVASTWAASAEQRFSGTKSYSDSPGAYYKFNTDTALTQTSPVTLNGAGWRVSFYAKTQLESGYDFLTPEVSTDGGATWVPTGFWLTGISSWAPYSVPIGNFTVNTSVKVRFRLTSDDFANKHGVWIDDIQISRDPSSVVLFSDDVEGAAQFTGDSPWAVSADASLSPIYNYSDSPGMEYANGQDIYLTQNAAVLINRVGAEFQFGLLCDLEPYFDFLTLELSTDGGATWESRLSITDKAGWTRYSLPLAKYFGQSVRVRFRLFTDDTAHYDGVHLDDLIITAVNPTAISSPPPAPPTGLTASAASATQVNLSWTDGSTNETQWRVERKTGTGAFAQIASISSTTTAATGGTINYSDLTTAANVQYTYRLRAYNVSGMSNYTATASVTTPP